MGSYFMIALMAANLLNQELAGAPLLDAGYALTISVMVQGLTYLGCWWHFNRTGEVA